jgi:arylsulfatase A-like enzyme
VIQETVPSEGALDTPATDSESRRLFLPVGSTVSYAFFAEANSSLDVGRLAIRGYDTEFLVVIESDDMEPRRITQSRSLRLWSEDLGLTGGSATRLTLQVVASKSAPGDGALLTEPVISGTIGEAAAERLAPERRRSEIGSVETGGAETGESESGKSGLGTERPNVIVYLIDTLRRDRLGSYGYDRPTSPEIDEFAAEATFFANSHGQSSWTKPTVASLFTGVWPPKHGATGWKHRLPASFETLAERLQQAGWSTAGFVTNVNAGRAFGIAQGFDTLWYQRKVDAAAVNGEVFTWLDNVDRSRPFFLYVHTMDPHAGYKPREPYRSAFAPNADQMPSWKPRWKWPIENAPIFSDLYDAEVAQNDAAFGELLDRLRQFDLYEDSLVIFLSDHGEEFREHGGWRHNRRLFSETLDVPLVIKFPGQKEAKRSDLPVSHVDVLPTVLDVVGLPAFEAADGQSLTSPVSRPIFSHLRVGRYPLQYSVIRGQWKLIRTHKNGPKIQLFNLEADPGEARNLASELPVRAAAMEALLEQQLADSGTTASEETEISDETERELRALGYLK